MWTKEARKPPPESARPTLPSSARSSAGAEVPRSTRSVSSDCRSSRPRLRSAEPAPPRSPCRRASVASCVRVDSNSQRGTTAPKYRRIDGVQRRAVVPEVAGAVVLAQRVDGRGGESARGRVALPRAWRRTATRSAAIRGSGNGPGSLATQVTPNLRGLGGAPPRSPPTFDSRRGLPRPPRGPAGRARTRRSVPLYPWSAQRRGLVTPSEVEAERAVQVRALPFELPSALVDRAALAEGFLSVADRQVEALDFVEDLERACEAPSRRQIRMRKSSARSAARPRRRLLRIRPMSLPEPAVQAAGVPELVLLLEELRQFVDVVRGEVLPSQDELRFRDRAVSSASVDVRFSSFAGGPVDGSLAKPFTTSRNARSLAKKSWSFVVARPDTKPAANATPANPSAAVPCERSARCEEERRDDGTQSRPPQGRWDDAEEEPRHPRANDRAQVDVPPQREKGLQRRAEPARADRQKGEPCGRRQPRRRVDA